ncbi:MAG: hypothetical protein M9894_02735 [Planctomycetes bacterium]|nr:hypothetical protein [Planctomycetota bacterium]
MPGLLMGAVYGAVMGAWLGGPFVRVVPESSGGVSVDAPERAAADVGKVVLLGLGGGVAFGGAMTLVLGLVIGRGQRRARAIAAAALRGEGPLALAPGERLLEDGPANHLHGRAAIGGWLFLTDRRLVFLPHRYNLGLGGPVTVDLRQVAEAEPAPQWTPIATAIDVALVDGPPLRFVVGRAVRGPWVEAIREARAAAR